MNVIKTKLPGVLIVEPKVFGDDRGYFFESFRSGNYDAAGICGPFVQDNISFSKKGVLRGLHYQYPHSQAKLVQVLSGEVADVAVDIRTGSPTYGQWVMETLSEKNHRQLYIPAGFAHGLCVLSEAAVFSYKCTEYYDAPCDAGVIWNDADLKIDWPVDEPLLSDKDIALPRLCDIAADKLPRFEEPQ